jgi:hypothetical protein
VPALPVRHVGAERGLPVAGTGSQLNAVRPGCGENGGLEELGDGLAAVEPRAQRRHREADVLGNQLDEGVNVGKLPGRVYNAPAAAVPMDR